MYIQNVHIHASIKYIYLCIIYNFELSTFYKISALEREDINEHPT